MMVWFLRRWGAISEGLFELGEQLERGEWSALRKSDAVRKWGEGGSAGSGIGSGEVGSGVLSGIGSGNASENWIGSGSGDASGGMVSSVSSSTYPKASAQVGYRPSASFTEGVGVQGGSRSVALPGNVAIPVPVPAVQEPSRRRAEPKGRVKELERSAGLAGTDRAFSDIKLPAKSQTGLHTPPTFSSMYGDKPVSSASPPDRPLTPAVFSSTYTHADGRKSGKGDASRGMVPSASSYTYPKDGSAHVGYQPSVSFTEGLGLQGGFRGVANGNGDGDWKTRVGEMRMPETKSRLPEPGATALPVEQPTSRRRAHSKATVNSLAGTDRNISDAKLPGSPQAQPNVPFDTPPTFSSMYADSPLAGASPPDRPPTGLKAPANTPAAFSDAKGPHTFFGDREVAVSPKEFTQAYAGGGVDRESPGMCTMRDGEDARGLESVDAMLEDMLRRNEGAGEANVRGRKRRSTVTQKPAGGVKERNGVVVQPLLVKSRRGTLAAQDDADVRAPGASMIGEDARRVASPKVVDDRDVVNEDDSDDGRSMKSVNSSFHLYDRLKDVGAVSPDLREIVERIMAHASSPGEK
ncbi:hypothetical protein DFP72DRAFT_905647 [Ephemerocybe angulata]|uniref:Uncharacterized protein n=1 Tax=Ephemerocybe angulata TaxID=980116 RepID=A0A8H6HSD6_9AGAR|nr:hypothetical protein DFP72DRAFT_905647 [Tulosesus angulatus]